MKKTDGDGNIIEVDDECPIIDYDERAYMREQMKLRKRFSNNFFSNKWKI